LQGQLCQLVIDKLQVRISGIENLMPRDHLATPRRHRHGVKTMRYSVSPFVIAMLVALIVVSIPGFVRAQDGCDPDPRSNRTLYLNEEDHVTGTEYLDLRNGFRLGFNANGGGYMSEMTINGSDNLIDADPGRGVQSSLRDYYHSRVMNPTQAGFTRDVGATTTLKVSADGKRITISSYRLPMYRPSEYDFIENEDLYDDYHDDDGGNSDTDGLDETGVSQVDEIASDIEGYGFWENIEDLLTDIGAVSAVRHYMRYDYEFDASAYRQFSCVDTDEGCSPVLVEDQLIEPPKIMNPKNFVIAQLTFADRIKRNVGPGFKHVAWLEEDANGDLEWHGATFGDSNDCSDSNAQFYSPVDPALRLGMFGDYNLDRFPVALRDAGTHWDYLKGHPSDLDCPYCIKGLTLLSTKCVEESDFATDALAIGLYYPPSSSVNADNIWVNSWHSDRESYFTDRRFRASSVVHWRDPRPIHDYILRTITIAFTFLRAPSETLCFHERVRFEVFLIFGTPEEILQAIDKINDHYDIVPPPPFCDDISCTVSLG
jgi:hypothetical protein